MSTAAQAQGALQVSRAGPIGPSGGFDSWNTARPVTRWRAVTTSHTDPATKDD